MVIIKREQITRKQMMNNDTITNVKNVSHMSIPLEQKIQTLANIIDLNQIGLSTLTTDAHPGANALCAAVAAHLLLCDEQGLTEKDLWIKPLSLQDKIIFDKDDKSISNWMTDTETLTICPENNITVVIHGFLIPPYTTPPNQCSNIRFGDKFVIEFDHLTPRSKEIHFENIIVVKGGDKLDIKLDEKNIKLLGVVVKKII